jgi:Ca2+-binding RTX toxin-like protein
VTSFDADDVSVSGGTLSAFTIVDGKSFTATFTADDGLETLGSVTVGTDYADAAGNVGTAGSDSVAIDTLNPTVVVNIVAASLNDGANSSIVTFEFSKAVSGFDADDVSVTNGTLSDFAAVDGDSFTATFTANDGVAETGSVSVGTGYTDAAGNVGVADSDSVAIDTLNPTVVVNIVAASLNDGANSSSVTFEFSEVVSSFDADDVSVTNGTLSDFAAVDGDSFTATFTANDVLDATGSVSVGMGYTDVAGNVGAAGSDSVAIDTLNPTVVVNIVAASLNDGVNSSSVTFEFSEVVSSFDADDVSVTNGTLSDFAAVDGDSFTATFTANDGIAETGSVSVGTGYMDAAGNVGVAGSDSVTIDTLNPTVVVNIVAASLNDGANSSSVTFEFSKAVSGFDADDVSVTNGTLSDFAAVDGDSFTATFTANDGVAETGSVSVGTGYTDAAGNVGVADSDSVTIDTLNPTVVVNIVAASLNDGVNSSSVTIEFSEAVSSFDADDVSVTNGTLSDFVAVDGDSFTATFTADDGIDATGSMNVGTGYTDAAGNAGVAGLDSVTIDTLNPTVVVNIVAASLNDGANSSTVTFEFSEAVSGFDADDVSVTNGTLSDFAAVDGDSFTATFTANAGIAETGSVSLGTGYTDAAGNVGVAGLDSVAIDTRESSPDVATLPNGGGLFEIVQEGDELVIRVAGGAEVFRRQISLASDITIQGSSGDDILQIQNSDTVLSARIVFDGGDGNDAFDGAVGTGGMTLNGGAGSDTLIGGAAADVISGGDGDDFLKGNGDSDSIFGDAGNDSLFGGAQPDLLQGGDGNDKVNGQGSTGDSVGGGLGDDTIDGGSGNDLLQDGGDADITIRRDAMTGGLGNDVLISVERALITGGDSSNRIDLSGFFVPGFTTSTVLGGLGNDTIIGSEANEVFRGDHGDDVLIGNAGNDYLAGGAGRDDLDGGTGNDRLRGQGGSGDRLSGGPGKNDLNGGAGIDLMVEEVSGNVKISRDNRFETDIRSKFREIQTLLIFGTDDDNVIDASTFSRDGVLLRIFGGGGNDLLLGSRYDDSLDGGDGNDTVNGGGGNDSLFGGRGDDGLSGYTGDDVLSGGDGSDTLVGHDGEDSLFGDAGADTLVGGGGTSVTGDGVDELIGGSDSDFFDGMIGEDQDFNAVEDTAGVFAGFESWVDLI